MSAGKAIYHMCRREEWAAAQARGRYDGSSQDQADGFIHFSTAAQVREVVTQLMEAGHWQQGDLPILEIFDAGYDPMRIGLPARGPACGDPGAAAL